MAFNRQDNSGNSNGRNWTPSDAFVNVYLTNPDGSRGHKLGGIPLKSSKAWEGAVIKRLSEGGEEALKALEGMIQIDFQRTDKTVDPKDLGF